jgi:FkbM family methyltransferase
MIDPRALASRARSRAIATARGVAGRFNLHLGRADRRPEANYLGLVNRDIRTVIDVGSNQGEFIWRTAPLFPRARYLAFEPLPEHGPALKALAARLGRDVRVFPTALGEKVGVTAFLRHVEHGASSSVLASSQVSEELFPFTRAQERVELPITTLDEALQGERIEAECLVKMDVQGYEDRVIRGGQRTLRAASACIVEVCVKTLYEGQATFDDIYGLLRPLGFSFSGTIEQFLDQHNEIVYLDALFMRGA